jgi:hypothetical protein
MFISHRHRHLHDLRALQCRAILEQADCLGSTAGGSKGVLAISLARLLGGWGGTQVEAGAMFNLSPERAARLRRNFRGLSVIVFALTAIQAFLGSAGFFRAADSMDYTAIHEFIANALFPLGIILFGLVFMAQFQRRNLMLFWTGLLLIAIISQIGIGYSARNNASLLAWHIPSGVAIFGFAMIVMLLSFGLRFQQEEI